MGAVEYTYHPKLYRKEQVGELRSRLAWTQSETLFQKQSTQIEMMQWLTEVVALLPSKLQTEFNPKYSPKTPKSKRWSA
jgi:hypothetical protein